MAGKFALVDQIIDPLKVFALHIAGACRDLVPIILVIVVFQMAVLRQPFPALVDVIVGLIFVILGLALFLLGLEIGLFPIGEALAEAFARKGSLFAFGTLLTISELLTCIRNFNVI